MQNPGQGTLVLVQDSLLRSWLILLGTTPCESGLLALCGLLAWDSASSGITSPGSVLLPKFKNWILC